MSAAQHVDTTPIATRRWAIGLEALPILGGLFAGAFLGAYWVWDQAFGIGDANLVFGMLIIPGSIWIIAVAGFAGFLLMLHKRPRRLALAFFLAPVATLAMGLAVANLILSPRLMVTWADRLGIGHVSPSLISEINGLPRDSAEPALRLWDMHYRGLAVKPRYVTLVYDESDEVALPDDRRSAGFQHRLIEARQALGTGIYPMEAETGRTIRWLTTVTPLHSHFYYVEQIYGGKHAGKPN